MRHRLLATLLLAAAAALAQAQPARPGMGGPGPGMGGPGPGMGGPGPGMGGPGPGMGGPGPRGRGGQLVLCESDNGALRECRIPGRARIELVRQLSNTACVEGRTWGVRHDRVWVDRGCRAEFSVSGGAEAGGGWSNSIVCASEDQRAVTCPWDSRLGRPRLLEQLSGATCREDYSWGQARNGDIWVSRGCRGRFGAR